jgi:hypothetical protein
MFLVFGAMFVLVFVILGVTICGIVVCGPILLLWSQYLKEKNPPERIRRIGNRVCLLCVSFFVALIPIILCGIVVNRMLQEQLISAASAGDTKTVERILRIGIDVDATDEGENTPLMRAAEGGYTDTVRVLLRYHAYVNHGGGNGDSALKLAQQHDYQDTVRVLKDAGAQ